ncbi:ribonuclease HII [Candidatus Woesearchaeota archaeon]|nr:ribonuclease HII [Candidatus Woesearchaeota archaeon]
MLVCGIDEAGRGPIIGPMVMAGVLVDEEGSESLKAIGVKDSKLLAIGRMRMLFGKIKGIAIRHKIVVVQPAEIDAALESDSLNLNWLEAHKSAEIINALKPEKAIIDSPSNNVVNYKRYLVKLLDNKGIEVAVEHKADLNHVECGAASILAKVTREDEIEKIKKKIGSNFGSGYLTDPLTKAFLEKNFDKHPEVFRKSWMPYKRAAGSRGQKRIGEF